MATKKFNGNPALDYISAARAEETAPAAVTDTETAPNGYKLNPMYIETKSKRLQLLVQPSIADALKASAKANGVSLNELANMAFKEYLEKNRG